MLVVKLNETQAYWRHCTCSLCQLMGADGDLFALHDYGVAMRACRVTRSFLASAARSSRVVPGAPVLTFQVTFRNKRCETPNLFTVELLLVVIKLHSAVGPRGHRQCIFEVKLTTFGYRHNVARGHCTGVWRPARGFRWSLFSDWESRRLFALFDIHDSACSFGSHGISRTGSSFIQYFSIGHVFRMDFVSL